MELERSSISSEPGLGQSRCATTAGGWVTESRSFWPHRAAIEKIARPEGEADPHDRHAGPIFGARNVVGVDGVPDDHILILHRFAVQIFRQCIGQGPFLYRVFVVVVT